MILFIYLFEDIYLKTCKVMSRDDQKELSENSVSDLEWEPKLFKVKDTFEILGEKCLKYIEKSSAKNYNDKVVTMEIEYYISIYLTSKLDNKFHRMPSHIGLKTVTTTKAEGEELDKYKLVEKATKIAKKKISSTFFEIPADALFLFYNTSTLEYESKNEKSDKSKKKKSKKKKKSIKAIEEKEKL